VHGLGVSRTRGGVVSTSCPMTSPSTIMIRVMPAILPLERIRLFMTLVWGAASQPFYVIIDIKRQDLYSQLMSPNLISNHERNLSDDE